MSQINYVGLDLSYVLVLIYLYKNWEMKNNPITVDYSIFKTSIGYRRGGDQRQ